MRARTWRWLRLRIRALFAVDSRIAHALAPPPPDPRFPGEEVAGAWR